MPITFTDDDGVVWDVWEVTRPRRAIADDVTERTPSVNYQISDGTLCFLSARGKRRLDRYPRFWSVLSEAALKRLCLMAEALPHSEIQRLEDPPIADLLFEGGPDTPRPRLERS